MAAGGRHAASVASHRHSRGHRVVLVRGQLRFSKSVSGLAPATMEFWIPNEPPCVIVPGSHGPQVTAASSGGRRDPFCLIHAYCSLARLPPTHPFVGAPILQRHFQVARPPASPPCPPPSHIHAGWMVSATTTPTSWAPSQDQLFPLYM